MAKTKGAKFIPLFTKEAETILTHSILQSGRNHTSTGSAISSQTHELHSEQIGRTMYPIAEDKVNMASGGRHLFCQSCQISMADREEQVSHYRLDWHRYNLKRKLKGLPPVRQEDFEKIAGT